MIDVNASDVGFRCGKCDGSWRLAGDGGRCFHEFVSGFVAWDPCKEVEAVPVVVQSLANRLGIRCATLNSFKKRLAVTAYYCALSGAVGPCPAEGHGKGGFLFFVGGYQLISTYFGRMGDNRISKTSYRGYHGCVPFGDSACCRFVGLYSDVGHRLQTYVCYDDLLRRLRLPGVPLSDPCTLGPEHAE